MSDKNYGYLHQSVIRKHKKIQYIKYLISIVVGAAVVSVAWAAFSDKGKVAGSYFKVASTDIKLLQNMAAGPSSDNLKDEINGPSFENISAAWSIDYGVDLYNNGSIALLLTSNANYTTANDPDELRSNIYVEIFDWNDYDNDISIDEGELGNSYGRKTITKWKTEGFALGRIEVRETKSFILRFSAEGLGDTKQGKEAIYDFEFGAIQE